jgi:hypothetical protein
MDRDLQEVVRGTQIIAEGCRLETGHGIRSVPVRMVTHRTTRDDKQVVERAGERSGRTACRFGDTPSQLLWSLYYTLMGSLLQFYCSILKCSLALMSCLLSVTKLKVASLGCVTHARESPSGRASSDIGTGNYGRNVRGIELSRQRYGLKIRE